MGSGSLLNAIAETPMFPHKWVDSVNQLKQDVGETRNCCSRSVAESLLTYARPWLLSLALGENLR